MKVRAIEDGFFDMQLRKAGSVFVVEKPEDLGMWMEPVNSEDIEDFFGALEKVRKNPIRQLTPVEAKLSRLKKLREARDVKAFAEKAKKGGFSGKNPASAAKVPSGKVASAAAEPDLSDLDLGGAAESARASDQSPLGE